MFIFLALPQKKEMMQKGKMNKSLHFVFNAFASNLFSVNMLGLEGGRSCRIAQLRPVDSGIDLLNLMADLIFIMKLEYPS